MNPKETQLTADIMRRIRAVYFMRQVFNPMTVKGVMLVVSIASFTFLVSIPHVIGNMSHVGGFTACVKYLLDAFTHTELGVQSIVALSVAISVWFVLDIMKGIRRTRFIHAHQA